MSTSLVAPGSGAPHPKPALPKTIVPHGRADSIDFADVYTPTSEMGCSLGVGARIQLQPTHPSLPAGHTVGGIFRCGGNGGG
ncbi:hypothetical protein [Myxococcus eversor]|uniref:hypothetical protein n=1 Tax=Myxococcus eversor TaxID=2709661 RepID=UPI0013D4E1A0|nr:hypothetical protein [Myxococcus eversor]